MAIPSAPLSVVVSIKGFAKISIAEVVEGSLETGNELGAPVVEICDAGVGVVAGAILPIPDLIGDFCEKGTELDGFVDCVCDREFENFVEADMTSVAEEATDPG